MNSVVFWPPPHTSTPLFFYFHHLCQKTTYQIKYFSWPQLQKGTSRVHTRLNFSRSLSCLCHFLCLDEWVAHACLYSSYSDWSTLRRGLGGLLCSCLRVQLHDDCDALRGNVRRFTCMQGLVHLNRFVCTKSFRTKSTQVFVHEAPDLYYHLLYSVYAQLCLKKEKRKKKKQFRMLRVNLPQTTLHVIQKALSGKKKKKKYGLTFSCPYTQTINYLAGISSQ